jgi:hypothetical protein
MGEGLEGHDESSFVKETVFRALTQLLKVAYTMSRKAFERLILPDEISRATIVWDDI